MKVSENGLLLRRVCRGDLLEIREYRAEFIRHDESMDGTSCLWEYEDMDAWFKFIERAADRETCSETWVPDTQYVCVRELDGRIVGMLDIRDELNDDCLKYYGHMGYSVRRSERRKGYAAKMVALALEICRKKGIESVLITCDRENIASARTIQKNGGMLENEVFDPNDGTMTQRYWIAIEK